MTGTGLTDTDRTHLGRAIELGRLGWGQVHPNPMVGCVLVRDARVLAEAHHRVFGGDHAEAAALASAGDARGATAYVSLEPCRHQGKTPPCTEALFGAGITRVVYWAPDRGEASGGGGAWLAERGVEVVGPVGEPWEWAAENPFFFRRREGRPYVALKLAISLDGGIAPAPGERRWLTGAEALEEVHRLRAGFDAVLVGSGTWRVDDPRLTVRGPTPPRTPPVRILLDRQGDLSPAAAVFEDGAAPVWVAAAPDRAQALERRLGDRARVFAVDAGPGGLDLNALLATLDGEGIERMLCEGGGILGARLLALGLVDRLYVFLAPVFLGGDRVTAFPPIDDAGAGSPLTSTTWKHALPPQRLGEDVLIILDRSD